MNFIIARNFKISFTFQSYVESVLVLWKKVTILALNAFFLITDDCTPEKKQGSQFKTLLSGNGTTIYFNTDEQFWSKNSEYQANIGL